MHPPAQERALANESLGNDVASGEGDQIPGGAEQTLLPDNLETTPPVKSRGRLIQPDVVVIDDTPRREDDSKGVNDQGGIEILQIARADDDGGNQHQGRESSPRA